MNEKKQNFYSSEYFEYKTDQKNMLLFSDDVWQFF